MKRKYKRGSRICCLDELAAQEVVFFRDKVLHHSFFQSWQMRLVIMLIQNGSLYRAEKANEQDGNNYDKDFWGTEGNDE